MEKVLKSYMCPACHAHHVMRVRTLTGKRTGQQMTLFCCLACRTFFNTSRYQEDDVQLKNDVQWHLRKFADYRALSRRIIKALLADHPKARTYLDIGAGVGASVKAAEELGMVSRGVEPNRFAVEQARLQYGISLESSFFTRDLYQEKFDIITISHVLEHLEDPRELLEAAGAALDPVHGVLYVEVPMFSFLRHCAYLLWPNFKGSPFSESEVHRTNFSALGLRRVAQRAGLDLVKRVHKGMVFKRRHGG